MFARCGGLFIQASADRARSRAARPSRRRCSRPPSSCGRPRGSRCGGCGRRSSRRSARCGRRSCRRAMARECRRAALESLRFNRSGRRLWRARSALSTQSVARTRARLLAVDAEAFAAGTLRAAEARGTLKSRTARAATTGARRLGKAHALLDSDRRGRPLRPREPALDVCSTPFWGPCSAGTVGRMPPAAILDVDGTLVDTNYHHAIAWYRAFRQHEVVLPIWRIHRHIGMGGDQLVEALGGERVEERAGRRHPRGREGPLRGADRRGRAARGRARADRGPEGARPRGRARQLGEGGRGGPLPGPARRARARRRLDHLRRRRGHEARARPRRPRWRRPAAARP